MIDSADTTARKPLPSRLAPTPWLMLAITMTSWGGNVVAARFAVGEISPMALVCLRWFIVCAAIAVYAAADIRQALARLRPHWLYILLMGATGFTASNSLLYEGARFSTGVNISIIQGVMPVMVLIGARVAFGSRVGLVRLVGVALTILGILIVATRGDPRAITRLEFNNGDLLAFIGAALYSIFTLGLRQRPKIPAFAFFLGIALAAFATSVPAMIAEAALGGAVWPGLHGILVLLYVAIFTSIIGQALWVRCVELIGPSRAGVFQNLVPVIGAILSVIVLREEFHWYHALSLALVLGGIYVSEQLGRR